ncbi:inosine triphosphate pyrophosphatase-like protein [Papiliotrema laurentii]|uniref:Inosine triphosphate pyrophosphatase-like protein n=1 Tax=Papiliotrema laurentii TaxID=5418 RepID=A0AAD9CST1_PAPLA|nr:inosine triphosphate pyrophosphatase-like protein [Papiliotrema laurentii]
MSSQNPSVVLDKALKIPVFSKLAGRRVILASSSPRRKQLFEHVGIRPEIVPSTFAENLPHGDFAGRLGDYPIATAGEKAIEVYERLVRQDDRNPPDLVISADTVVIFPPEKETREGGRYHGEVSEIMEKPVNKDEQTKWLNLMSGRTAEVVTGVTIVYPCVEAPGYKIESLSNSTIIHFFDNPKEFIDAYVESEEGLDRAGGFAIQDQAGLLIEKIEGNYDNTVGFPSAPFWHWMSDLASRGVFDEAWSE